MKAGHLGAAKERFCKLTHAIRKRLSKCAQTLHGAFAQDGRDRRGNPKKPRRPRMIEICTWTCMVTCVAIERGWDGYEPITIENGFDLRSATGQRDAWQYMERVDPDVAVCEFPCTPWSRLQWMNYATPEKKIELAALQ